MKPPIPLPAPLRAAEPGTFARHSVIVRLPEIGKRILEENRFPAPIVRALADLLDGIPHAEVRPLTDQQAPDALAWDAYLTPSLRQTWLEIPWFLAETYFYRRVVEATGYFLPGAFQGYDPFARQKRLGLESGAGEIQNLADKVARWLQAGANPIPVGELLQTSLWGNQADLSMWPAGEDARESRPEKSQATSHLLVDDTPKIASLFSPGAQIDRVDLVLDNSGVELVADLCLADTLLSRQIAHAVHLHAKMHPTFVSDVIEQDVVQTLDFLSAHPAENVQALSERLRAHLRTQQMSLSAHPFWTSPLAGWEMPADLHAQLAKSGLVISKGDANYRRWLGDRHWPFTTPAQVVLGYLPAPFVALRVVKAEIIIGLQPGQMEAMNSRDPEWLVDGKWGIIQSQA